MAFYGQDEGDHLPFEAVKEFSFNLEPAVGREKAVQALHVQRECEYLVVTLLVMKGLSNFLGA